MSKTLIDILNDPIKSEKLQKSLSNLRRNLNKGNNAQESFSSDNKIYKVNLINRDIKR